MCEHLGFKVLKLKRIRIMNIKLDVPVGKYRELSKELGKLEQLISDSSKRKLIIYLSLTIIYKIKKHEINFNILILRSIYRINLFSKLHF